MLNYAGVDGGFDNNEPEYKESYSIVILPDFVSLPFPSVELPEKVLSFVIREGFTATNMHVFKFFLFFVCFCNCR